MSRDNDAVREGVLRGLDDLDFSDFVVDDDPRPSAVLFTVRLTGEPLMWLADEAERHGLNPIEMIQELILRAHREATAGQARS